MLDKCIGIDRNTDAERPFRRSTFALRSMQMLSDLHLSSKLTSSIIITRGPNAIAVLHHHWNIEIILLPIVLCKASPYPRAGRRGGTSSLHGKKRQCLVPVSGDANFNSIAR
ncbi:hypothetical protein GW17_00053461 [Ensete ventricosum]|nr:hypothetical protein GW17_00053461 [Ensete ventricosum]